MTRRSIRKGKINCLEEEDDENKDCYPPYRDFSRMPKEFAYQVVMKNVDARNRGGKKSTFPKILFHLLECAEEQGYSDIVAWQPHGRSFVVKDKHRFASTILPQHFGCQKSFASFQRQLNVYGFLRMTKAGADRKSYYHELFLRNRPDLIVLMPRKRNSTASVRRSLDPSTEPNLYQFPPATAPSFYGTPAVIYPVTLENSLHFPVAPEKTHSSCIHRVSPDIFDDSSSAHSEEVIFEGVEMVDFLKDVDLEGV